ncbi:MAG: sugar transferase [Actinomycetota bacterium]|nr:sugar transferase [Actinomycetota bacterium]
MTISRSNKVREWVKIRDYSRPRRKHQPRGNLQGATAEEVATRALKDPSIVSRAQDEPTEWAGLSAARLLLDASVLILMAWLAYVLRFSFGFLGLAERSGFHPRTHLLTGAAWVMAYLVAMAMNHLYDEDTLFLGGGELSRIFRSCVEALGAISVGVFLAHEFNVSRSWFVTTAVLSAGALMIERLAFRNFIKRERMRGLLKRPVIMVSRDGDGWPEDAFEDLLEFRMVERVSAIQASEWLGQMRLDRINAPSVKRIAPALVIKVQDFDQSELWRLLMDAGLVGCPVFLHSAVRSVGRDRLTVREIGEHTLVKVAPPRFSGIEAFEKRALDVVGSGLCLIVLSPLLLLISLAILVTSGGPILFGQERLGKDGKLFRMWKFRTMQVDAGAATGPMWTTQSDPRRTAIGKLLRRISLDELPQFVNVLAGDMTLVGPRPEQPHFVEGFAKEIYSYQYRHRVRPGITGWAQVNGLRGNTSITSRVDFDNWYIEHWSAVGDVRILIRTLLEVFRGRNAY